MVYICLQTNGIDFRLANLENINLEEDDFVPGSHLTKDEVLLLASRKRHKFIGLHIDIENKEVEPDTNIMTYDLYAEDGIYKDTDEDGNECWRDYQLDVVNPIGNFFVLSNKNDLLFFKQGETELFAKVPRLPDLPIVTSEEEGIYTITYLFEDFENCGNVNYTITDTGIVPTDNKIHFDNDVITDFPIPQEEAQEKLKSLGISGYPYYEYGRDTLELYDKQLMWRFGSKNIDLRDFYLVGKDSVYFYSDDEESRKLIYKL
jgi:predicted SnoaL-like aldol condensation-catalyzing enzyme